MKKSTGLLISLAILILISYFFCGLILQSTFNKNINGLSKNPFFNLQVKELQRGWFSSQAILGLNMTIPERAGSTNHPGNPSLVFDLDYPVTLLHGPFVFSDFGLRFGIGQITTIPQTHYSALVNYLNNTVIRYAFPSLAMKMTVQGQIAQFALSGIQAVFQFSPNVDAAKGHFKFLGMNGSVGFANFKIGELNTAYDLNYVEDLWVGNGQINLQSLEATDGVKKFVLEDFNLSGSPEITNHLLSSTDELSIKRIVIENQEYGPGSVKYSIRNLNPAALATIFNLIHSMVQQPAQDWPLIQLSIVAELPKLLSRRSEFELENLSLTVPEGKIEGHFKIALPKEDNSDVGQLLRKAHGEGQFKAPMVLVKKLIVAGMVRNLKKEAMQPTPPVQPNGAMPTTPVVPDFNAEAQQKAQKILDDYIAKGILQVAGSDYVVTIKIEDETFFVNGKPFNPGMI